MLPIMSFSSFFLPRSLSLGAREDPELDQLATKYRDYALNRRGHNGLRGPMLPQIFLSLDSLEWAAIWIWVLLLMIFDVFVCFVSLIWCSGDSGALSLAEWSHEVRTFKTTATTTLPQQQQQQQQQQRRQ